MMLVTISLLLLLSILKLSVLWDIVYPSDDNEASWTCVNPKTSGDCSPGIWGLGSTWYDIDANKCRLGISEGCLFSNQNECESACGVPKESNTKASKIEGSCACTKDDSRRHAVPVMYVRGSHYDVGFDVGRTYGSLIKSFIASCERLRQFEVEYKTEAGREAYDLTLTNMKKRFPYYIKEIQGVADGASVPFHQLFLLQMDDIIETINENHVYRNDTGGCSSIGVNNAQGGVLAHTEDAFSETLNHFYILSAHIIPTAEDRKNGAVEEKFSSLCYAGHMPGYTMGYNEHGLVFSINTLSPRDLKPGATPRTFITRSILAARNFEDAERKLLDKGLGAANGFSLNMVWSDARGHRELYNVEVAPDLKADQSKLDFQKYDPADALVHCNKYQRLKVPEVVGPIIDSSNSRLSAIHSHPTPKNKKEVEAIISDQTGSKYVVFADRKEDFVKTIAAGVFDFNQKTWSLYIEQPKCSEPVAVLPFQFSMISNN